jgi:hypothetical protein
VHLKSFQNDNEVVFKAIGQGTYYSQIHPNHLCSPSFHRSEFPVADTRHCDTLSHLVGMGGEEGLCSCEVEEKTQNNKTKNNNS